jgi:hypothetical protein
MFLTTENGEFFIMTTLSKTSRVFKNLSEGNAITSKQACTMFKFASTNSFRRAISRLRDEGHDIVTQRVTNSKGVERIKYSMIPPRTALTRS